MVGGVDIVRVLDVDPDLGEGLEPRALAVARPRAVARRVWLEPGPWQPLADEWDHRGHLGLLIVDGFLMRSMHLAVAHLRRVETRVLVVLWHFADRWGSVRSDGVALHVTTLRDPEGS